MLDGRPGGGIRLEVDDRQPAARAQRRFQLGEIRDPVADVMIGVHDKNEVDRLGKVRGIASRLHRHKVRNVLASGALAEIANHVRFDIGGEDFAFRNTLRDLHAEIAGSGADIRHA